MARILLIDDDRDFSHLLQGALEDRGYEVQSLDGAEGVQEKLKRGRFDVVLLDNRMPGISGIDFLATLREHGTNVPVILMTSHGTTETAIRATNLGAFDYVIKPLVVSDLMGELEPLIKSTVEISRGSQSRVHLPGESTDEGSTGLLLLGNSKPMQEVCKLIGRVANSDTPVLIHGETGSGKELVARAVHAHSGRSRKPFVAINCTALNEHLLDDELFGHESGAFTGAAKLRKGRFEYADGGTLFLDEVGDMPLELQAKLLRVLETHEVSRIGSNECIKVDVRIVAATHRDLDAAISESEFREDLFYRLNGVPIHLPPLRDRAGDLRMLAEHFLTRAAVEAERPVPSVHDKAWEKIQGHHWPGNVRQLQNVLRRAVLMCRGQIMAGDVQFEAVDATRNSNSTPATNEEEALAAIRRAIRWALDTGRTNLYALLHDMLEKELLQIALQEFGGNQTQVAKRLGMARNTVHSRIESYGLDQAGLPVADELDGGKGRR